MAGWAGGSASLSMSGRNGLMALKQESAHSLTVPASMSLSNTRPILYTLYSLDPNVILPVWVRYESTVSSCRLFTNLLEKTFKALFDLFGHKTRKGNLFFKSCISRHY